MYTTVLAQTRTPVAIVVSHCEQVIDIPRWFVVYLLCVYHYGRGGRDCSRAIQVLC